MASTLSRTSLILSLVVVSSYQLCEWQTCIESRRASVVSSEERKPVKSRIFRVDSNQCRNMNLLLTVQIVQRTLL
ncbi:hypothetical protein Tco_0389211 [Tanacetum coccineum]